MGQYYCTFVMNKETGVKEIVDPRTFDDMSKLMEHSWWHNSFANATFALLKKNDKLQIAWVGDYANANYEKYASRHGDFELLDEPEYKNLCEWTWDDNDEECYVNNIDTASNDELSMLLENEYETRPYLVNHTKKEFVNLRTYKANVDIDGWCVNPLPLLTSVGNGCGGGDYHKKNGSIEFVGTWAFDEISWTNKKPCNYDEIEPMFINE